MRKGSRFITRDLSHFTARTVHRGAVGVIVVQESDGAACGGWTGRGRGVREARVAGGIIHFAGVALFHRS